MGCKLLLCGLSARRKVFVRGTRPDVRHSSAIIGRASGSAAAALISSSVIGRMGISGKGHSSPFSKTSTTVPSERIFAVVVFLLMFFRSSGRNNANLIISHGVGDIQQATLHQADNGIWQFTRRPIRQGLRGFGGRGRFYLSGYGVQALLLHQGQQLKRRPARLFFAPLPLAH